MTWATDEAPPPGRTSVASLVVGTGHASGSAQEFLMKSNLWNEFRQFLAAGNVLALAVAVVLGVSFGAVVKSFTDDILMQLIAAIGAKPSFEDLALSIRGTEIRYGAFLNAIVGFFIVAMTMFVVVKVYARLTRDQLRVPETERELLRQIRDALRAAEQPTLAAH